MNCGGHNIEILGSKWQKRGSKSLICVYLSRLVGVILMFLKKFLTIGFVAAVFFACGDNGSSAVDSDEESSSSVCEDCDGSSSSKAKSSSSIKKSSSSSAGAKSSSSKKIATNSSSSCKDEGGESSSSDSSSSSSSVKSSSSSAKSSSSRVCEGCVDPSTVVMGTMTDERDGQIYKTVTIGTQTWMAENLNYETAKSYCYDNKTFNCYVLGRLYSWSAAMDSAGTWTTNGKGCGFKVECTPKYPVRGVCPEGWHLPTQTEWDTLFTAAGGSSSAGWKLRSTDRWDCDYHDCGTDDYSFSAKAAGCMASSGDFFFKKIRTYFWSSNEDGSFNAYNIHLNLSYSRAELVSEDKKRGYSVRCVKD